MAPCPAPAPVAKTTHPRLLCSCEQHACRICRHRAAARRSRLKMGPPTRSSDLKEELLIRAERLAAEREEEAESKAIAWYEKTSPFAKLTGGYRDRGFVRTIRRAD
jgi:hypothetical protein